MVGRVVPCLPLQYCCAAHNIPCEYSHMLIGHYVVPISFLSLVIGILWLCVVACFSFVQCFVFSCFRLSTLPVLVTCGESL